MARYSNHQKSNVVSKISFFLNLAYWGWRCFHGKPPDNVMSVVLSFIYIDWVVLVLREVYYYIFSTDIDRGGHMRGSLKVLTLIVVFYAILEHLHKLFF